MSMMIDDSGALDVGTLRTGNYVGQPTQRYLKIAWAYAGEISKPSLKKRASSYFGSQEERKSNGARVALVKTREETASLLGSFIAGLTSGGYLGDSIDLWEANRSQNQVRDFRAALARFARDVQKDMRVRVLTSDVLPEEDRKQIRTKRENNGDKAAFSLARDRHFLLGAERAVTRQVRYVGMGENHRNYLQGEGFFSRHDTVHPYNMEEREGAQNDLSNFVDLTERLEDKRNEEW